MLLSLDTHTFSAIELAMLKGDERVPLLTERLHSKRVRLAIQVG